MKIVKMRRTWKKMKIKVKRRGEREEVKEGKDEEGR